MYSTSTGTSLISRRSVVSCMRWPLALGRLADRDRASVPILKFLSTRRIDVEGAAAESIDRCQDIVGGLGP
jgi:hypothetical protein